MSINRGDTIVEVMISMAILGLVLSFSYASASRSLKVAQDAQERSYATKLAESQIEMMNAFLSSGGSSAALQTGSYCIAHSAGSFSKQTVADVNDYNAYPSECIRESLYHLAVTPATVSGITDYRVTVRWDSILAGRSEIEIMYKVRS